MVALGLLAHESVGASAPAVLGIALTVRIAVIVLLSPWPGIVASRLGVKASLIACNLLQVVVVLGFLAVDNIGQIYGLTVLLNAGSALFSPIYKATIPGVVGEKEYSRALAWGRAAYDASNILGPAVAGLVIVLVGLQGNFILNACSFGVSAWLLFELPRQALLTDEQERTAQRFPRPQWLYGRSSLAPHRHGKFEHQHFHLHHWPWFERIRFEEKSLPRGSSVRSRLL